MPLHWFWPQSFSALVPQCALPLTLLSRWRSCEASSPCILGDASGKRGGSGVLRLTWCTSIKTRTGGWWEGCILGTANGGAEDPGSGMTCWGAFHCPPEGRQRFWNQCTVKCSLAVGDAPPLSTRQWTVAPLAWCTCRLRALTPGSSAPWFLFTSVDCANTQHSRSNCCGNDNLRSHCTRNVSHTATLRSTQQ